MSIPAGQPSIGSSGVFVVRLDGDLWLHANLLDGASGAVRCVDLADSRVPVKEGPGPARIGQVAGAHNGVVFYRNCCEPASGNLLAATSEDSARVVLAPGDHLAMSADGTRVATVNMYAISVVELGTSETSGRLFGEPALQLAGELDLAWSADGRSLLVLHAEAVGYRLSGSTRRRRSRRSNRWRSISARAGHWHRGSRGEDPPARSPSWSPILRRPGCCSSVAHDAGRAGSPRPRSPDWCSRENVRRLTSG